MKTLQNKLWAFLWYIQFCIQVLICLSLPLFRSLVISTAWLQASILSVTFPLPFTGRWQFFSNILGMSLPLCDIHVCHICCYFTSGSPFFNLSTLRPGYTPSPYPYLHSMIMNVKSMCICWQIVIYIILWYYYLWYIIVYIVYI